MQSDGTSEICSIKNGEKCLKTFLVPSTGDIGFEVKDHNEIIYKGESFERATTVYEDLCKRQGSRSVAGPIQSILHRAS